MKNSPGYSASVIEMFEEICFWQQWEKRKITGAYLLKLCLPLNGPVCE